MSIAAKNSKTAGGLAHRLLCHSVCSYLEFMGMVSHGNERSIIIPLHFPDSFRAAGILCPNLTEARALEVIFYKLCKRWSGRKARPLRQAIVKIIENLPRKEIKAVLRFRICFHCGLYQLQHQELLTHRKNFTCFCSRDRGITFSCNTQKSVFFSKLIWQKFPREVGWQCLYCYTPGCHLNTVQTEKDCSLKEVTSMPQTQEP